MSLTIKDIEDLARLARLHIDEQQKSGLVHDLDQILEFVDQLAAAPVGKIAPMAHPLQMQQRLRPDQVSETDQSERFQAQAPATEAGLYLVPRVID